MKPVEHIKTLTGKHTNKVEVKKMKADQILHRRLETKITFKNQNFIKRQKQMTKDKETGKILQLRKVI